MLNLFNLKQLCELFLSFTLHKTCQFSSGSAGFHKVLLLIITPFSHITVSSDLYRNLEMCCFIFTGLLYSVIKLDENVHSMK